MRLRAEGLSGTLTTEVVVLGGGPAGSAAALVLADAGHSVTLVRPERPPGASLAQSIPPSARALLSDLGMLPAVEAAGFVSNRGNTVRWAGSLGRTERFRDGAHGFHVDRGALEATLDAVVGTAGVHVVSGAAARSAERVEGLWRIGCLESAGETIEIRAPWVVDATGRHGFFARRLGRRPDRRTTTLALVSRVEGPVDGPDIEGHTLVESFEDGWAWSVPVAPGVRCVTAMIDPRETHVDPGGLPSALASRLRKAPLVASITDGGAEPRDVWACPASLYTCARYTDEGVVLAGDAGAFIDPLSSYGVKKALASGRLAGIVVGTAMADRPMATAALSYHDAHERSVARDYVARSAAFFEEATNRYGHPFWSRRLEAARASLPTDETGATDVLPAASEIAASADDVRRAHQVLRSTPRLEVREGATARWVEAPTLAGRRIVMEDHLVSHAHAAPIRFHRSVDLRRLVRLAPRHDDVAELWSAYNRSGAHADLPEFITALAAACAAGFLTTEEA